MNYISRRNEILIMLVYSQLFVGWRGVDTFVIDRSIRILLGNLLLDMLSSIV